MAKNKIKRYEIEFSKIDRRVYYIDAESPEEAKSRAWSVLDEDFEVGEDWKKHGELTYLGELEKDDVPF